VEATFLVLLVAAFLAIAGGAVFVLAKLLAERRAD
jgi:hypothetical protein